MGSAVGEGKIAAVILCGAGKSNGGGHCATGNAGEPGGESAFAIEPGVFLQTRAESAAIDFAIREKTILAINIMKMKIVVLTAVALLLGAAFCRAADFVLPVAIFDFESKDEAVRDLGPKIATLVNANLSAERQIVTVERAELDKVLGEHELGLSGTVSSDSAAKVGQLTGAKVLVTGRVFKVDDQLFIVAKIIGTETSRVYGEMVQGSEKASIANLSADLAKKIAADVVKNSDTLVAKVETRAELVARIKKALGDKALPSVSVKIGEQHFGQRVVDPAAETELSSILQDCGFKLVDGGSTNRADVLITGDAFSAYGSRKGNLISCKSRVEVKALRQNGDLITVDRQTSVAVDIAEQTAAKTALQNAAVELAERLLLKIAK